MRAVIVALVLGLSFTAAAQPGSPMDPAPSVTPVLKPPGLTQPTEPAPPPLTRSKKNRTVGTLLALGGTAVPVLMFVAAINIRDGDTGMNLALASFATMIVAPSAGHWYAGKILTAGMGLRALGGTVAVLSLMVLAASEGDATGAETAFWCGTITLGVGAVYDIATAGSAVDEWNEKHVTVMPTALKVGDGYGIGVVGRF